jgi:hypothetical protein
MSPDVTSMWIRPWLAGPHTGLHLLLARPGCGKTRFLIQLALDELLRGHQVLHVSLGRVIAQVEANYNAMLPSRLEQVSPAQQQQLQLEVMGRRAIQVLTQGSLEAEQLQSVLATYEEHLGMKPRTVVVDGSEGPPARETAEKLARLARQLNIEIWFSVPVAYEENALELPRRLAPFVGLSVQLKSKGDLVLAEMLPADFFAAAPAPLLLHAESMRPQKSAGTSGAGAGAVIGCPADFTLLSGAATGTEEAFGELAEKFGLRELNFTFAGRECNRRRGLVVLSQEQLMLGSVSFSYFTARTGRHIGDTAYLRRVLQSIWHQVNPAGEVFCIGEVLPAGSVKGGTGWAVELAKQQQKPVWVFDQKIGCWYEWFENDWRLCNPPRISHYRFCGTGTRHLSPEGRRAIEELFARSFSQP